MDVFINPKKKLKLEKKKLKIKNFANYVKVMARILIITLTLGLVAQMYVLIVVEKDISKLLSFLSIKKAFNLFRRFLFLFIHYIIKVL